MDAKHLIEAVVGIFLGLALYPSVDTFAANAAANASAGSAGALLLPIVPVIYLLVVIAGAVAYVGVKR